MNRVHFAIVLHFHQPVGNLDNIFDRAYKYCYKPYLEFLSNNPEINITAHFSGSLLDYLDNKHPELVELIKHMVSRGQIEVIAGAYYEPILTAIPERDAIGQINMMSEYIKKRFNFTPEGMWIPERVWEAGLTNLISKAGLRYCVLDDTLLIKAGIEKEGMESYFLTGDDNSQIAIFPFDKKLRYIIPFKLPHETIDYLKEVASKKENFLLTYGDDGEKFGEWPGTHEWVYKKEWLSDFFAALKDNSDWIKLVKLSDFLASNKPTATINIPEGSYVEMAEWAGGPWINFLTKYSESNQMYKKLCYVSAKVEKMEKTAKKEDTEKVCQAQRELYKGQCNCAYWHGLFGGLYFYHLRRAIYNHLISAEKIADEILHKGKKGWLELKQYSFGSSNEDEFIMENNIFSLYFDPAHGGALRELDYKPLASNLINTLSRKKEAYHKVPHPIDKYPRYCLRDHFIKEDIEKDDFANASYDEFGDFADGSYIAKKKGKKLTLEQKSQILNVGFKLSKEIEINSAKEILVSYRLEKEAKESLDDIVFAVEFNMTMPLLNSDRYNYFCDNKVIGGLNTTGSAIDINSFGISDSKGGIAISFTFSKKPQEIWYFPVKTVAQSEGRYKRSYQASCILPRWKLDFGKSKDWNLEIAWKVD